MRVTLVDDFKLASPAENLGEGRKRLQKSGLQVEPPTGWPAPSVARIIATRRMMMESMARWARKRPPFS